MGVFGVTAASLLPRILGMHFPSSTYVHFRWVGGFGKVPQAVPYFLQHLLAVAVAGRECFEPHLSVSFGFLPSLHVRAYMMTMKGMKRMSLSPGLQQSVAGGLTSHLHAAEKRCMTHICYHPEDMSCYITGWANAENNNYRVLTVKHDKSGD